MLTDFVCVPPPPPRLCDPPRGFCPFPSPLASSSPGRAVCSGTKISNEGRCVSSCHTGHLLSTRSVHSHLAVRAHHGLVEGSLLLNLIGSFSAAHKSVCAQLRFPGDWYPAIVNGTYPWKMGLWVLELRSGGFLLGRGSS